MPPELRSVEQLLDRLMGDLRAELIAQPAIADLQWFRFTDSVGDPAVRVVLVLHDNLEDFDRVVRELRDTKDRISSALLAEGIHDFPYIRVITSRDAAEQAA